jgi:transcriptional regulator with XRE-family HTH domain
MLSPIKTNLSQKLKDRAYRQRFFRGRAQDEIAYQLRALRKERKLAQKELEKLSGMKQSAISRIEQASYCSWNFQTLLKIADALDLRVRVIFERAEDVIREYETKYEGGAFEFGAAQTVADDSGLAGINSLSGDTGRGGQFAQPASGYSPGAESQPITCYEGARTDA